MYSTTCTHPSNAIRYSDWFTNDHGVDWRWKWCHFCGDELAKQRRTSPAQ